MVGGRSQSGVRPRGLRLCATLIAVLGLVAACTGSPTGSPLRGPMTDGSPTGDAAQTASVPSRTASSTGPSAGQGDTPAVTSGETDTSAAAPKPWLNDRIRPVSAVAAVDGVAVVYGTAGTGATARLVLYGLDPADGQILWQRDAALGVDADSADAVDRIPDRVAYLRPTDQMGRSQLVLADPATGSDELVTAADYFVGTAYLCPGGGHHLCIDAYRKLDFWRIIPLRIDPATAELAPDPAQAVPDDLVGNPRFGHLGIVLGYDPYRLVDVEHGRVRWQHKLSGIAKDVTDNWAVNEVRRDARSGVVAVTLRHISSDDKAVAATDALVTVGLSGTDGSLLWTHRGTRIGCLPAADESNPADPVTDGEVAALIQCRFRGTLVRTAHRGTVELTPKRATATVSRLDPTTGKPIWTLPAADGAGLPGASAPHLPLTTERTTLAVRAGTSTTVIGLSGGAKHKVESTETLWCEQDGTFPRPAPRFALGKTITTARVRGVVFPCDAAGRDTGRAAQGVPALVAATFDARAVLATPDGVSGVPLPSSGRSSGPAGGDTQSTTTVTGGATGATSVGGQPVVGPPTQSGAVTVAWTSSAFTPVTGVVLHGDTALFYGLDDQSHLRIVGVDAGTGKLRWSRRAGVADLSPTWPLEVGVIGDSVAYFAPSDDLTARMVFADAATGKILRKTTARRWASNPYPCGDKACLYVWLQGADDQLQWRSVEVDPTSGAMTAEHDSAGHAIPKGFNYVLDDLVFRTDSPNKIGAVHDGRLVWSKPAADILGKGRGVGGDWRVLDYADGLHIDKLISMWDVPDSGTGDLAKDPVLVSIDPRTGTVRWTKPGVSAYCHDTVLVGLPGLSPGAPDSLLACRYSGRTTDGDVDDGHGLSVTLLSIDPITGKTNWSIPLGPAPDLVKTYFGGGSVRYVSDHEIVVGSGTGARIIDLAAGRSRTPDGDETVFAVDTTEFWQPVAWHQNDHPLPTYDRLGAGIVRMTHPNGTPVEAAAVPRSVPSLASVWYPPTLRIVARQDSVIAYRTG